MVERLVANEKVEGSTPFARSIINMFKLNTLTIVLQKLLDNKDIRYFKKSFFYYIFFRLVRNFLKEDIIIKIYNFKVFGSINKGSTSHALLKKCEFGDYHELNTIKKFSKKKKIFLIDCGCNYGFYSFFTASLSQENIVISLEASQKVSNFFLRNLKLNNFDNISFINKAISNEDEKELFFNESMNDWESSLSHNQFKISKVSKVKSIKIDTILKTKRLENYYLFIKLDIEGHEIKVIEGALKSIEKFSPIIIIEFSKYIFDNKVNIDYLNHFLNSYDYEIYDTNNLKIKLNEILFKIKNLDKDHKTIGNYYLIKRSSILEKLFVNYDRTC